MRRDSGIWSTGGNERRKLLVCDSAELADRQHRIISLLFKKHPRTAIVLRYAGQVYAYLNQCVHMVRRLDCVHDAVFDEQQGHLRCEEIDGQVYLIDKRVTVPEAGVIRITVW